MKFFLLLVVFVCAVFIGVEIAKYFRRRYYFFLVLCSFCETLKVNISYSRDKLNDVLGDFKQSESREFEKLILNYKMFLKGNMKVENLLESNEFFFLKNDEKKLITNFFSKLGNLFYEEELEKIEISKQKFSRNLKVCEEEKNKYSSLYLKIFIILGLVIVVIFL